MGWLSGIADWRRRRVLERTPLTDAEWQQARRALPFLDDLDASELARLRELVVLFLDAKEMTGANGLELDNPMRLSIATQACLPILNLGLDYYRGWVGIVVYPGEFVAPREVHDEDGVVHEYDDTISGEAWEGGPVILSWEDASGAADDDATYNVVIHEFAHKLDMLNGEADGLPPLHADMDRKAWQQALAAAYDDFCRRADAFEAAWERADELDDDSLCPDDLALDPYAAEHPSEFFAVMSEAFFVAPQVIHAEYPEVYAQFAAFYRQDPLARVRGGPT
jgi:Mlc titration factor MtfA (ptsG expression regulator)